MPVVHKRIMSAEYTDETHTRAIIVIEDGGRREISKFGDPLDWQEMLQSVPLRHYQAPQAVTDAMRTLPAPVQPAELLRLQAEIAALKARPASAPIDLNAVMRSLGDIVRAEVAASQTAAPMIDITPVQQRIEALENVLKEAVK